MGDDELRKVVLSGIPPNRLADLGARAKAGSLTALEALALSVLRGGAVGEEATPALLDEALAVYAHGSYRVPVRVVADWERAKVVVTLPEYTEQEEGLRVARRIEASLKSGKGGVLVVSGGTRVEVYETAKGQEASDVGTA